MSCIIKYRIGLGLNSYRPTGEKLFTAKTSHIDAATHGQDKKIMMLITQSQLWCPISTIPKYFSQWKLIN